MENISVDFRCLDFSVCFIPSADEVNADMKRTSDYKKYKKFLIRNISFYAVKNEFCQVYEKEHIENLLYRVFEYRKNEKQFIGFPYLF